MFTSNIQILSAEIHVGHVHHYVLMTLALCVAEWMRALSDTVHFTY